MWNPFGDFPREMGYPYRRHIVYNSKQLIEKLNLYNHKTPVYTSLYSFEQLNGALNRGIYTSANINKIYFDLDKLEIESLRKFHEYALKKDLFHTMFFSGGGFHIYIGTSGKDLKNKKGAVANCQVGIANELELNVGINGDSDIDGHIIGNIAQMVRVPCSYNLKRHKYCIPLKKEDLTDIKTIERKSRKQIFGIKVYGNKLLDLTPYDGEPITNSYENIEFDLPMENIGLSNINIEKFPACIQSILKESFINHRQRYILILYLKELGIPIEDTLNILKNSLDWKVFIHCVREEKQPYWIYKRGNLSFPSCGTLRGEGFCVDKNCSGANLY